VSDIYKPVDWTVAQLVMSIDTGVLRLPDLQRPFVWPATNVRDLMDSMYRGYPVGELMFWNRAGDDETTHLIFDGQQRLTTLFVMITGKKVIDDEYRNKNIRISFNPFLERFEVAQPAFDRSPLWVSDISTIFASPYKAINDFTKRLEDFRNSNLENEEKDQVVTALGKVDGLRQRVFKVVELQPNLDKAIVADVFVRINSMGTNLTAADFILTWLSVFWPEGRDLMENFVRNSRLTAERVAEISGQKTMWTPRNHYLAPSPGQLVRVAVAVGQRRGRLQDSYSALRARDRVTGLTDSIRQQQELEKLQQAVPLMLNHLNWDEFIRVLSKAGFRSRKMITSRTTVLYSYALWLIGRDQYKVDTTILRNLMSRWFFMAQTTGRYTGSPETRIQQDLDRVKDVSSAQEFVTVLEDAIATVLPNDYWTVTLPDEFVSSSAAASPAYQAYLASLNILGAQLFMLDETIHNWTDPTFTPVKGMEGHHLFPKAYLRDSLGYSDLKKINQIANFAPTDWATNNLISDRAPSEYWPELVADRNFQGDALSMQLKWHALPAGWHQMSYEDFLSARRKLLAGIVRDGFLRLSDPNYQLEMAELPALVDAEYDNEVRILDLIEAGFLKVGEIIETADTEDDVSAVITEDGEILFKEKTFESPTHAAQELSEGIDDGWDFWTKSTTDGPVTLNALREQYLRG
jgi:hypothetical protein